MSKPKLMVIGLDAVSLELVKHFAAKGVTPAISSLMERGCYGHALPCFPIYTPTNWATIFTGSEPGTNLSYSWLREVKGEIMSTFDARALAGDNIFAAAARQGLKTVAIQYPGAYPPPDPEKNLVLAPLDKGLVSYAIYGGKEMTLEVDGGGGTLPVVSEQDLLLYAVTAADLMEAMVNKVKVMENVGAKQDGFHLNMRGRAPKSTESVQSVPVKWAFRAKMDGDRFTVVTVIRDDKSEVSIPLDEWSDFFVVDIPTKKEPIEGMFRFKAFSKPVDGRLRIARSEIYPTAMLASKPEVARDLLQNVGGFFENSTFSTKIAPAATSKEVLGHPEFLENLEEVRKELKYQIDWIVKAAVRTQEIHGWDIFYLHWHWPDSAQHRFLHWANPSAPGYDPALGDRGEKVMQMTMELCDYLIREIQSCAGKDTTFCIVSDHGMVPNVYNTDIEKRLVETGLAVRDSSGALDLDRSRALPEMASYLAICVNTEDRGGPVPAGDYEKVQEEIIDALLDWRTDDGKRVVAFALKRKDAPIIGVWGDLEGDVFFCNNSGFSNMGDGPGSVFPVYNGSQHSSHMPTTFTDYCSNMAMFIISGPSVKEGVEWDAERWGIFRLTDFVPTICAASGIRQPLDTSGAIRWRILKSE